MKSWADYCRHGNHDDETSHELPTTSIQKISTIFRNFRGIFKENACNIFACLEFNSGHYPSTAPDFTRKNTKILKKNKVETKIPVWSRSFMKFQKSGWINNVIGSTAAAALPPTHTQPHSSMRIGKQQKNFRDKAEQAKLYVLLLHLLLYYWLLT